MQKYCEWMKRAHNPIFLPVNSQLFFLIAEALRGWKQHRTVIFPSVVTIFLCSVLLAASLECLQGALRLLDRRDAFYEAEAFFPNPPTAALRDTLQQQLLAIKIVESVHYISPDSAAVEFQRDYSPEMLSLVEGNPLPASFRITLLPEFRNPPQLRQLLLELERWHRFDMVQAPVAWTERIERWRFSLVFWPLVVAIFLLVVLALIVGNAVRLTLYARKTLVENMRYAGGSFFFILFPFVLEGFLQGLLGSGLAVLLWGGLVWVFVGHLPAFAPYLAGSHWVLALVVILVALTGTYASYRSVRSFLNKSWR